MADAVKVEIVCTGRLSKHVRARQTYDACASGLQDAGHRVLEVLWPTWSSDWIIMWGLGHPEGQELLRQAAGRRQAVLGWDLGYWGRQDPEFKYRLSVNATHPSCVMAKDRPLDRWEASGIQFRNVWNPEGWIVLVGMGRKSTETYNEQVGAWEKATFAQIKAVWPGFRVLFKPSPKQNSCLEVGGLPILRDSIENVLVDAAAVVCRHSNAAIDAIIAGVPAIVDGGAAAAVCKGKIAPGEAFLPLDEGLKRRFLGNLAWFQWAPNEMRQKETWTVIGDIVETAR